MDIGDMMFAAGVGVLKSAMSEAKFVYKGVSKLLDDWGERYLKIESITYRDILQYVRSVKDKEPEMCMAVVKKEKETADGCEVLVFCCDKDSEIIKDKYGDLCGRKYVCKTMDEDLNRAFGNKNIIILQ
ncbi:MAG: hypothetical protein Q4E17_05170 [Synergistes sp.]|nr:hypothetical protein [Synergistes sp.]